MAGSVQGASEDEGIDVSVSGLKIGSGGRLTLDDNRDLLLRDSATITNAGQIEIKTVVTGTRTLDQQLCDDARTIELELLDIRKRLSGDRTRSRRSQMAPLSISQRISRALFGTLRQTHGPTETHREQFEIGREQFVEALEELSDLLDGPYQDLLDDLDDAGAPWTSGRGLPAAVK